MGKKETFEAQQQAVRDVAGRVDRLAYHEDAIRVYLAGITYAESHPRPAGPSPATATPASTVVNEPAQPVDEPAPLAPPAAPRR